MANNNNNTTGSILWHYGNAERAAELHGLLELISRRLDDDERVPEDVLTALSLARRLADELTDRLHDGPEALAA